MMRPLLLVLMVSTLFLSCGREKPAPAPINPEEYKASCLSRIDYRELKKNPDKYIGARATYRGTIVQIFEQGNYTEIILDTTESGIALGLGDVIYVQYHGTIKELEGDTIQVWGELKGSYTYESVARFRITIPLLEAKYVEPPRRQPTPTTPPVRR